MTENPVDPDKERPEPAGPHDETSTAGNEAAGNATAGNATAGNAATSSEAEPTPGERPKAPGLKTPSGGQRVVYSVTSPETRTGRFLRGLLRWAALIIGLFALGLLVTYLLLYRPTLQQLERANQQATQTAAELQKTRQDLAGARQNMQSAQSQAGEMQDRLEVEVARSQILRAMNSVTQARVAIQSNNKAGAVKNLDTAQGYLQAMLPVLSKRDLKQADTLQALFTLTKNDLDRDLKLAGQDLDRLQSELERAEANVLK